MTILHAAPAATQTGVDRTIKHDGRTREYRLYTPPGLDQTKPEPLVFALHGGGGNAAKEEARIPYNEYARRDGWLVWYTKHIGSKG